MPSRDPFRELGLDRDASSTDVRRARRRLATRLHPDAGGQNDEMSRVNAAAAEALAEIHGSRTEGASAPTGSTESSSAGFAAAPPGPQEPPTESDGRRSDVPSFVVEALPAVTFEALTIAAAELGEVADDDPPYRMWVLLDEPACWCRLDVVPDAGASTVGLAIAPADALEHAGRSPLPTVESIRDAWIAALNALDWAAIAGP